MKDFNMKDYLSFDLMITPMILKVVYIAGVIISILVTLIAAAASFDGAAALFILGSGLVWQVLFRIICEQMALMFSIHGELVRSRLDKTVGVSAEAGIKLRRDDNNNSNDGNVDGAL